MAATEQLDATADALADAWAAAMQAGDMMLKGHALRKATERTRTQVMNCNT
mgnify:CR=1 FL=1